MPPGTLNTIRIDDPSDPRVAPYMNLKDAHLAVLAGRDPADRAAGLLMAEGELVVRTAIDSAYLVESVLGTPARLEAMADALARLPADTPVYAGGREVIERIVGFDLHRGVLAACSRGTGWTLEDLLARCRTLVVLEDLANHDNVGGIFRNVAALGGPGAGVVLSPRCCDPLYRKAVRVSMGQVLRIAFAWAGDWPGVLERIGGAGFERLALTPNGVSVGDVDAAAERVALVLGAEGPGLSEAALERSDRHVRIPMAAGVDSLNVAAASAIALHRLARTGPGA